VRWSLLSQSASTTASCCGEPVAGGRGVAEWWAARTREGVVTAIGPSPAAPQLWRWLLCASFGRSTVDACARRRLIAPAQTQLLVTPHSNIRYISNELRANTLVNATALRLVPALPPSLRQLGPVGYGT
jgi:hypothetical protein